MGALNLFFSEKRRLTVLAAAPMLFLAALCPIAAAAKPAPAHNPVKSAAGVRAVKFVSYRAIYDITLENMAEKSDITGLTGRMAYEFSGSNCEGWTTQFRLLTHVDMKEDAARLTDRQSTTFESADGREFRFATKNYLDNDLTEEVVGTAKRGKKGLEVLMTKPDDAVYKLKDAYFPLMQMKDIVSNALAGKHFLKMGLFDGSSEPDSIAETTIIIGGRKKSPADDRESKFMGAYADAPVWPVTISYFDDAENKDGLPSFRTEFLLYENGITRDLFMDYGDFSVRGRLIKLDILSDKDNKTACKK